MPLPYSETVMEHFRNPRNVGRIEDADAKSVEGSPACGDMVAVYLKVDPESLRIDDIKFESYGCASNIATGSIITEMAKGKTLEEAKNITWKQASEELGGLPPIKTHCSVLAVDGLRGAIENYEERHGGLDLVRTKVVKDIELSDGTVRVVIGLPADHQFAANIREEIMEKIEPLWDVEKVIVEFAE